MQKGWLEAVDLTVSKVGDAKRHTGTCEDKDICHSFEDWCERA